MNIKKAVRIIAEYMGTKTCRCCDNGWDGRSRSVHYNCGKCDLPHMYYHFGGYHKSLDALVPVWEKYSEFMNDWPRKTYILGFWGYWSGAIKTELFHNPELTIQEAACMATAKAIEELGL